MAWFMVLQIVLTRVASIQLTRMSAKDKGLEIVLLRRQPAIHECAHRQSIRLTLVVLGAA